MTLRATVIIATGAALAACESMPTQPPPPPAINVYTCATPAGMTEPEGKPLVPVGDYTQKEVSLFITALDQWGTRGWLKVAGVRNHAERCASNATATPNEDD